MLVGGEVVVGRFSHGLTGGYAEPLPILLLPALVAAELREDL